jgi:uncharacterized protein (TIGR03435 family)
MPTRRRNAGVIRTATRQTVGGFGGDRSNRQMDIATKLLAVAAAAVIAAAAQSAATDAMHPHFEVASVKAVSGPVPFHPYELKVNHENVTIDAVPLRYIITMAYDTMQVEGGPGWANDERYDLQAKTGNPDTTKEEARAMLRTLLADRFSLAVHRETKQLPLYLLKLGANGPKLKESEPGEKLAVANGKESGTFHMTFQGLSMPGLASTLTGILGRPVRDRTGLTGTYDFKLDFAPDMNGAATEPGLPCLQPCTNSG